MSVHLWHIDMFRLVNALVNGCISCALFNAVPNVYLHNWKERVMQQTKYGNNVIMTSVLERKNKQTKTRETDVG